MNSQAVCLALGWNGDAAALVPAGAPHPEAAHAFLNFVLRPEVAAQEARYTRYATGNRAALALLDESLRSDPAFYPPAAVIQKLEPGMPLDAEGNRRREVLWKEIRG